MWSLEHASPAGYIKLRDATMLPVRERLDVLVPCILLLSRSSSVVGSGVKRCARSRLLPWHCLNVTTGHFSRRCLFPDLCKHALEIVCSQDWCVFDDWNDPMQPRRYRCKRHEILHRSAHVNTCLPSSLHAGKI